MTGFDLLQQASFERLLARYERTFGTAPPLAVATLDEAIAYMRARLAAEARPTGQSIASVPEAANRNWSDAAARTSAAG